MAKRNGLTAKQMIGAIEEAQGYVTKAVDVLGVSRTSFYNYLKKHPTVQQTLDDIREKRHEYVENKLMQAIKADNLTAIIFYLKTQAKHLGYVERQELAGVQDKPLVVIRWDDENEF